MPIKYQGQHVTCFGNSFRYFITWWQRCWDGNNIFRLIFLGSGISVYCLATCLSTFLEVRQPENRAIHSTNIFTFIICFIIFLICFVVMMAFLTGLKFVFINFYRCFLFRAVLTILVLIRFFISIHLYSWSFNSLTNCFIYLAHCISDVGRTESCAYLIFG